LLIGNNNPVDNELKTQIEQLVIRMSEPLGKSEEELNYSIAYLYKSIEMSNSISPIFARLLQLFMQGRPKFVGKDKWDKEVTNLLVILSPYSTPFDLGNGLPDIPAGCGKVYYQFMVFFMEMTDVWKNYQAFSSGIDARGLAKATEILVNKARIQLQPCIEAQMELLVDLRSASKDSGIDENLQSFIYTFKIPEGILRKIETKRNNVRSF
jgi:hypothetical protein